MMTADGAGRLAMSLPEVIEGTRYGNPCWSVRGKTFVWLRPFSKADLKRFGDETPPDGPILAVSTADLSDKEAILAGGIAGVFTIEHFDNYPAVLIALRSVRKSDLATLITDGWLTCAPTALAEAQLGKGRAEPGQ